MIFLLQLPKFCDHRHVPTSTHSSWETNLISEAYPLLSQTRASDSLPQISYPLLYHSQDRELTPIQARALHPGQSTLPLSAHSTQASSLHPGQPTLPWPAHSTQASPLNPGQLTPPWPAHSTQASPLYPEQPTPPWPGHSTQASPLHPGQLQL